VFWLDLQWWFVMIVDGVSQLTPETDGSGSNAIGQGAAISTGSNVSRMAIRLPTNLWRAEMT
jgi:hypothetical protein